MNTELISKVETITPQVAYDYILTNVHNRKTSPATIEAYAKAMREGKWQLNGDTIVFDTEGKLINGQHRLYACIKANVPFKSLVARNVPHEAFSTYDCGRHRTAGQLLGLSDVANSHLVASCIPLVKRLRAGSTIGERCTNKRECTNQEIVRLFNEDPAGYIEAASMTIKFQRRARVMPPSIMSAMIYYLCKVKMIKESVVTEFFENVISYTTSSQPTLETLRLRLLRNSHESGKRIHLGIIYNLTAKTWNAWMTGKVIKSVAWTPSMSWTQII